MAAVDRVRDGLTMRTLRVMVWAGAGALLLLPAVAMQFTREVQWTALDFVAAGAMLGGVCAGFELLWRRADSIPYLLGGGVALAAAFLLVWVNLAVGVIGSEQDDANMMFAGVLAVGFGGAAFTHFRAAGMARAMVATAVAHGLAAAIALVAGLGSDGPVRPRDVIGTTVIFTVLWLTAAWLFRKAAEQAQRAH